jgi:hypothetical protein
MNTREPIRRAELTEHDLQQVTGERWRVNRSIGIIRTGAAAGPGETGYTGGLPEAPGLAIKSSRLASTSVCPNACLCDSGLNSRMTWRFSAVMMPILASIVGPPRVATRINALFTHKTSTSHFCRSVTNAPASLSAGTPQTPPVPARSAPGVL